MQTLVLTAAYEPLARISWKDAMKLVVQEKVEIVDEYKDRVIRTVSVSFKMPSVIRLLRMFRRKRKQVKFSRDNVYARDSGKCQYCKKKISRAASTYDHVIPRSRGGATHWENVVISCLECNQKKGDNTPSEAGMRLVKKPVKPKYVSSMGRFTILYEEGMPISWKQFLIDAAYWEGSIV